MVVPSPNRSPPFHIFSTHCPRYSMATSFSSRFRRGGGAVSRTKSGGDERVGEMVSDSSEDGSPLGGDVRRNAAKKAALSRSNYSSPRSSSSSEGGGAVAPRSAAAKTASRTSEYSEGDRKEKEPPKKQEKSKNKTFRSRSRSQSSRTASFTKKGTGRKWYSDSDEEDEVPMTTKISKKEAAQKKSDEEEEDSDLDAYIAGSMMDPPGKKKEDAPNSTKQSKSKLKRLTDRNSKAGEEANGSDGGDKRAPSPEPPTLRDATTKKTNVLKLMTKTRAMSPFGGKGKRAGAETVESPATSSPAARRSARSTPSASGHSASDPPATSNTGAGRPTEVQTGGTRTTPAIIVNRRTDRLKHSASGSEYGGSPRLAINNNDEVMSPGLRKAPGAFPGRPGSGVLLEGWLRQKQRRGIKGLKKWNSRYFVLYARSNEVRYYADVVQSAWGPIPLGEIGSISLRLIQRIGKLSHPKYKGCRFDITCRNSWGTHYADDYVSSDEENASNSNNVSTNSNNEKVAASTPAKQQEKSGTPRSSRVYSLVSDSPQVTVAWVNMLDSLLTRSANSPRPDVDAQADNAGVTSAVNATGRGKKSRAVSRQRSSALDTESSVVLGPGESVPKAIIYSINFIFDSTPGIETEKFYETEPNAAKLKGALKFLNEFTGESVTRKPTKDELEERLDAVTAGAVVRLWLKQLEQPLIPFTIRTMLACLLFHLNDVNVYSSKNGMDAARLAHHFSEFILRPQKKSPQSGSSSGDMSAICHLVEEMITNVDTFIDEKEAQLLEDNRL
ncbi:unnamed protein product [Phytophthora fragariaefolia]|uniref:Unnamed protein product n=1 Tax=Phytophthora fragariaefolia TaxID=1490495 RepID=A0A9W6XZ34_9STRA|nr:unnamed protein product [Phytophthora fragariaefolia]